MSQENFGGQKSEGESGNERRFLSLHAQYGSEVVSVIGPDNTLLYESDSVESLLGYRHTDEALVEDNRLGQVHPDDMESVARAMEACFATPGESPPVEYRIKDAGGNWRWLESRGVNLLDDPEVGGVVTSTRDITDRKRAEEALKESEEQFRVAFVEAPVGIALVGLDGRFLEVNQVLCEMFGHTEAELLSMGSHDLTHSEDHGASREWMARQERDDEPDETIELRFVRGDESIMWAFVGAALVRYTGGEPSHWVCHYQDITQRKQAEYGLQESEWRFRALVENSSEAVKVCETDGTLRYASPAFERIFGYEPGEAVASGMNVHELVHPDDLQTILDTAGRALEEGEGATARAEYRFQCADGSYRDVESVATFLSQDPAIEGVVLNVRDVTERKRSEKRLKLAESVTVNANDAVIISEAWPHDAPGPSVIYVNEAFTRMSGYEPEDIIGKTPRILQGPGTDQAELDGIRAALEAWEPVRTEVLNYRKDGTEFWVELNIVPVTDEGGRVTHWVSVQRNTTERRRVEEELRLKDRAIEASSNGIIITDPELPDNPIIYVNPSFEEITGYSAQEAVGLNCRFLRDLDEEQPVLEGLRHALGQDEEWSGTLRNYRKDGTLFYNELYIAPVRDESDNLTNFIGIQKDVTERKRLEDALEHRAFHDPLTDLPNRALFTDRLEHALTRLERGDDSIEPIGLAVLFMDLDEFKAVNDSLGHEAGDRLLVAVARRLEGCLRPVDTLSRLGGDEFCALLEDVTSVRDAAKVAERMAEELEAPFLLDNLEVSMRVSVGIALTQNARSAPGHTSQGRAEEFIRNADNAMYRAKEKGKAHYEVFEPYAG